MTRTAAILIGVALVGVVALSQLSKFAGSGVDGPLPLDHAAVIRQQARAKGLPPELIAGVIYAETGFRSRRSPAGAEGLMQVLPDTATFIARKSGGSAFTTADLANPAVNIRYGSWYLRYLLQRYSGNRLEAVSAYNAGMANVDRWKSQAMAEGHRFGLSDVGFAETRAYTQRVLKAAQRYRKAYPVELGIA